MNVASLELSKELYQASNGAWAETEKVWCPYSVDGGATKHWQIEINNSQVYDWPAYDLGYLLRSLDGYRTNLRHNTTGEWIAEAYLKSASVVIKEVADTPEDATAKLAIELFKNGVLEKPERERLQKIIGEGGEDDNNMR